MTIVSDRVSGVLAGINVLGTTRVMVGIPAAEATRSDDDDAASGINNAALGYIHDNGAPEANIPARPFLEPGIRAVQDKIEAGLRTAADAAMAGRPEAVDRAYHAIGLKAQAAVRSKITTGPFVELKPRTLANRRRRGRNGTKPLIDTGQLRNAIAYVIRKIMRKAR